MMPAVVPFVVGVIAACAQPDPAEIGLALTPDGSLVVITVDEEGRPAVSLEAEAGEDPGFSRTLSTEECEETTATEIDGAGGWCVRVKTVCYSPWYRVDPGNRRARHQTECTVVSLCQDPQGVLTVTEESCMPPPSEVGD